MHYIGGRWVDTGSHRFQSFNPATGDVLWEGPAASESEVRSAIEIARDSFYSWADMPYAERVAIAVRFKTLVEARKEELALLIAKETGKALWDARSEVAAVIGKLAFSEEAYQERTGSKSRSMAGGNAVVWHRPHGVMAVYGPYNFPAHLPNGHITPALLAGNVVVFKPSEQTPLIAEWMVRQWEEAGLPAGVLNLVQGERDTGIALANGAIDGLLFTGSSATGKLLHKQFAGRPEIMLALEMGGNNPLIISNVADVKAAVLETILSAYITTGQRCTCARRLIVIEQENTAQYIELLQQTAAALVVGPYDAEPPSFMGPVISNREADRLLAAQANLQKLGATVLLEMRKPQAELPFVTPALVDVTHVAQVPDEEYFGPLLQLYRVKTKEEAVAVANNTAFGLSASVLTDDPAEYQWFSRKLRAGLINWNRQTTGASGAGPFGGVGVSGNHRPAGYYAADYCAYPVASVENDKLALPEQLPAGITIG